MEQLVARGEGSTGEAAEAAEGRRQTALALPKAMEGVDGLTRTPMKNLGLRRSLRNSAPRWKPAREPVDADHRPAGRRQDGVLRLRHPFRRRRPALPLGDQGPPVQPGTSWSPSVTCAISSARRRSSGARTWLRRYCRLPSPWATPPGSARYRLQGMGAARRRRATVLRHRAARGDGSRRRAA